MGLRAYGLAARAYSMNVRAGRESRRSRRHRSATGTRTAGGSGRTSTGGPARLINDRGGPRGALDELLEEARANGFERAVLETFSDLTAAAHLYGERASGWCAPRPARAGAARRSRTALRGEPGGIAESGFPEARYQAGRLNH